MMKQKQYPIMLFCQRVKHEVSHEIKRVSDERIINKQKYNNTTN